MIYLGSHVSMKAPDYLVGAIKETISYGANACMIYTGAPSNSKRKSVSELKIQEAHALMEQHHIDKERMIIHAPYIINLANSIDEEKRQFGIDFLSKELLRVQAIGAKTLVLHPGSHVKASEEIGLQKIIDSLNTVLENDDTDVQIALETMAGKGSECGVSFEQLAQIKHGVHHQERISICMDTCHIHDAGYDLNDLDGVLDVFDHYLGLSSLACIHVNDSKNSRGARKDRHENIGKGYIGFDILKRVIHHPRLDDITKILETPYIDGKAPYKDEIQLLCKKD